MIDCNLNPMGLLLNRLVENENSVLENFISKQASFHKTCRNRYDHYHLQRKLEKLQNVHKIAQEVNCADNSTEPSDIKRHR